jgi:hypothetical protein
MPPSHTETYPLSDPAFLEDSYPVYHRMTRHDPVYWSDALGHWVLTRYAERPVQRRADSLLFRGLEALPIRFDS